MTRREQSTEPAQEPSTGLRPVLRRELGARASGGEPTLTVADDAELAAQHFIESHLARFARLFRARHDDIVSLTEAILFDLAPLVSARYACFYVTQYDSEGMLCLDLCASYARAATMKARLLWGEGLVGTAAVENRKIVLDSMPRDYDARGQRESGAALSLTLLPVVFQQRVVGVIELATLRRPNPTAQALLDRLAPQIGAALAALDARSARPSPSSPDASGSRALLEDELRAEGLG